jgi:hypothetical protein
MLNVELNIVGFRFSGVIPDLRRTSTRTRRFGPHPSQWRLVHLRQSHAA